MGIKMMLVKGHTILIRMNKLKNAIDNVVTIVNNTVCT